LPKADRRFSSNDDTQLMSASLVKLRPARRTIQGVAWTARTSTPAAGLYRRRHLVFQAPHVCLSLRRGRTLCSLSLCCLRPHHAIDRSVSCAGLCSAPWSAPHRGAPIWASRYGWAISHPQERGVEARHDRVGRRSQSPKNRLTARPISLL
jgi:hypothetical protein